MPQADRNSQKENKSRGNEPNFNWRGVILIVIAFSFIAMAMVFYRGGMQPVEDVPYNRFLELLENKQIVNDKSYPLQLVVEDGRPTQTLRGAYIRQGVGSAPAQQVPFRTTVYLSFTNNLQEKLAAAGIQPAIKTESNVLAQTVVGFLPIALFLLVLYFLFRQQSAWQGKARSISGNRKPACSLETKTRSHFAMSPESRKQKTKCKNSSSFCVTRKNFRSSAAAFQRAFSWLGPPARAKRCWRAPSQAKRMSRSFRSAARILSRCLSAWVRRVSATCSSKERNRRPVSFLSTKSTPSGAIAATGLAVATTSANKR